MSRPTLREIENLLTKGVSNCIDRAHLEKRLLAWEKLVVKFGIDPSGTKIHIGHMVPILKLRAFQELGHTIILLIGDATAQVGDTSDKDAERPMLAREETRKNAEAFLEKFGKILDLSKINIYLNSEWLDSVNFAGVGELAKNFSVAEMLDRDNFSKRFKSGIRISLQEFLYPIMQGYDSVAIARKYGSCDVEIGGNDQYFNILAGRRMMDAFGLPKQDIITFDLLTGTDGKKMSKTSPNCIAIDDTPFDMYQKIINLHDDMITHYAELATDMSLEEVEVVKKRLAHGEAPNILKEELAQRIIMMYHGKPYDPESTDSIEVFTLSHPELVSGSIQISTLLKAIGFCATTGDVKNALAGKSVRINGEVITDPKYMVKIPQESILVEMGKKKAKRVVL